jgi:DNA-directed RNA polymerase specialized sigma24 family protein
MTATPPVPDKHLPKTSWTLLVRMRGAGADADAARAEFTNRYYPPIYAYMRALRAVFGLKVEVEDLAQGFFTYAIFGGQLLNQYTRSRGHFRPYLKRSLRNYVVSALRKEHQPNELIRPDQWSDGWERLELGVVPEAEAAFHEALVRTILQEAVERVRQICSSRGLSEHFALFAARYLGELSEPPSWAELGERVGLDEKQARSRTETVAYQFRIVLRERFKDEVGSEQAVDEEIATLLSLL